MWEMESCLSCSDAAKHDWHSFNAGVPMTDEMGIGRLW
jgi:hypothetical protein